MQFSFALNEVRTCEKPSPSSSSVHPSDHRQFACNGVCWRAAPSDDDDDGTGAAQGIPGTVGYVPGPAVGVNSAGVPVDAAGQPVPANAAGTATPQQPGSTTNPVNPTPGGSTGAVAGTGTPSPAPTAPGTPPTTTPPVNQPPATPPACDYPAWVRQQPYGQGDIVLFRGKAYRALLENPGLNPTVSTYFWEVFECVGGGSTPPVVVEGCVLNDLLSERDITFAQMFDNPPWGPEAHFRAPVFANGYSNLCKALETPGLNEFGRSGTRDQNLREVAAFFANVAKETAHLEKPIQDIPGNSGAYIGRGAIQLTNQANYSAAGSFLGLDLVGNPQQVGTDPVTVWKTGLWFWMQYHRNANRSDPTCHELILQGDFASTIRKIKGNCAGEAPRFSTYNTNASTLGVSPGNQNVCN